MALKNKKRKQATTVNRTGPTGAPDANPRPADPAATTPCVGAPTADPRLVATPRTGALAANPLLTAAPTMRPPAAAFTMHGNVGLAVVHGGAGASAANPLPASNPTMHHPTTAFTMYGT